MPAETTKLAELPTLDSCLNLNDFEKAAEHLLSPEALGYYSSWAEDQSLREWNMTSYRQVKWRPRVLRDVSSVDLSTKMLGHKTTMPIFISPAAQGGLAHPDGEKCLARGAREAGIPYIVSAAASRSMEELAENSAHQTMFYQLYVNKDRSQTVKKLTQAVKLGYKGVCITIDAPVPGKRERDERLARKKARIAAANGTPIVTSTSTAVFSQVDSSLSWKDLAWVNQITNNLPLIVKGVQTADDAAMCAKAGVKAIYVSNHGGRQLESAPSSLEILLEIRKYQPQVFKQCEVYADGGIRRGADVLKAIALGATAVGIGRPFMYSLAFGDEGPRTVIEILREEMTINMRLLGATKISDITSEMVNTSALDKLIYKPAPVSRGFWSAKL